MAVKATDWTYPELVDRAGLLAQFLEEAGATERAAYLVGQGRADWAMLVTDRGLVTASWDRAGGHFSASLTPWADVRGIQLHAGWTERRASGAMWLAYRLTIERPVIDVGDNEDHDHAMSGFAGVVFDERARALAGSK
jgi:hypothetical protein